MNSYYICSKGSNSLKYGTCDVKGTAGESKNDIQTPFITPNLTKISKSPPRKGAMTWKHDLCK